MKLIKLFQTDGFRQAALRLLFVLTIISILWSDYHRFGWEYTGPHHEALTAASFAADNYDIPPLLLRARQCTSFIQTRSYWHEDYTPGIPFYRPLSLTWFWIEYHAFTPYHYNRWIAVSICLQLLFCTLFGLFLRKLSGSTSAALFTLCLFAGMRFGPISDFLECFRISEGVPGLVAVLAWKDQPTMLSDCALLSALIFTQREKWFAALFSAVVAVLFKEAGWITYALAFLMLAYQGKLSKVPKWVYVAAFIGIAIPMLARDLSGMGVIGGYRVGHNYSWRTRYMYAVAGTFFADAINGGWPAGLLGVTLYGICRLQRTRLILRVLAAAFAASVAIWLQSRLLHAPYVEGFAIMLDPSMELSYIILMFIFAVGAGLLVKERELIKAAGLLIIYSFIAALCYVAALQVNIHALELCYVCQASVVGLAIAATFRSASHWLARCVETRIGQADA
jgi:hypothetical protein